MTALRSGSATDTGVVRTNNEDALLVAEPLFAVADGMGGHAGGEVASMVAVEALRAAFEQNPTADGLVEAVQQANRAVLERAAADAELRGMATTLTALALVDVDGEPRLVLVNLGDSRAYLLQQGELSQLTEDHSLVEELVREGQMSPEEAAVHPQRHIVTRALGIGSVVEPDVWQILPYRGDRLLLCSDGLINEVTEPEIASVLRRETDPQAASGELVSLARQHGGADNITVLVVDVVDDDDRARAASAAVGSERNRSPAALDRGGNEVSVDTHPPARTAETEDRAAPPSPPRVRHRRLTLRVVVFVVILIALLGAAVWAVGYYARGGYYVGIDHGQVTIFKGRPGGLLWIEPTVAERTTLAETKVLPAELPGLRSGHTEGSLKEARTYVANLRTEADQAGVGPDQTTTTTAP